MNLDDDALRTRLAGPLGRLSAPGRDPEALASAIRDAALVLALLGPRAPRARDLARAVNVGADAAAALFGGPNTSSLATKATADLWLTGHALACVGRRSQAIGRLSLWHAPGVTDPQAALAQAVARWWRRDPAWDEGLEAALTAPDAALLLAVAHVLRHIEARDLDGVDQAIREGLRAHEAWASSRPDDPLGRVAIPLLAVACIAEGVGLVPRVESPFLPTFLVRGPARVRPGVVTEPLPELGPADEAIGPEAGLARAAELAVQVVPVLRSLAAGADLRPRPEDWPRVFRERADEARAGFECAPPPRLVLEAGQTELDVAALPAWAFGVHPAAREFPGGYARIRDMLAPDRVWVTARFRRPGDVLGVRVDGLVWLGDRWVWIPKPWRLVGPGR